MRPSNLIHRKFIYKYPLFGNGPRPGDFLADWRERPDKIKQTSKGIRWDKSVFYWWFEYLLRHEGYKSYCATKKGPFKALYEDWYDIHKFKDDFMSWFYRVGGELFAEPRIGTHISLIRKTDQITENSNLIYMAVPIANSKKHLISEFKKSISRIKDEREAAEGKVASAARYPVYATPQINALKRNLAVWDMKKAGLKSPQIHEELFGVLTDKMLNSKIKHRREEYLPNELKRTRQKRYYHVVNRAFKSADLMIENAALGKFPCSEKLNS